VAASIWGALSGNAAGNVFHRAVVMHSWRSAGALQRLFEKGGFGFSIRTLGASNTQYSARRIFMKFAKWVFRIVGTLGILEIVPLFFYEAQLARDMPPALTHPEYYYGFAGVTLAWQVAFWVIGSDPRRYRPLMPVAILEKAGFVLPAFWLLAQGRLPNMILVFALLDMTYGLFFIVAYIVMRRQERVDVGRSASSQRLEAA
jgi:hypothetical protein